MHDQQGTGPCGGAGKGGADTPAHVRAMGLTVFKRCLERSGMSPESFVQSLTQTSLSALITWSQAELEALLLACERHGLDPLGREVYMLRGGDPLVGPALVVVGVDGWSRILNTHKAFAGMQFRESSELIDGVPAWVECTLHRWDRRVPTRLREYLVEVRGTSQAWLTHPRRMLRHKALVQCARLAFGLVGIFDHDEAQRVVLARETQFGASVGGLDKDKKMGKKAKVMGIVALKEHLASCGG